MKSMTYAQKADLVAKCKRVFESVKRSNQVAGADKYRELAVKAIGDYELCSDAQCAFDAMKHRITTKPRYRYDNRAGEWVECKARDLYGKSIASGYADIERQKNAFYARMASNMSAQGNPFSNRLGINPNIMNTSCYQIGAGVNPLTGW